MIDLPAGATAEEMAAQALAMITDYVKKQKPFVFDAGAGAGKTETLKRVLEDLIKNEATNLRLGGHRIACITYTKVAAAEIASRIKHDSRVHVSTIHSFAWETISAFQPQLRAHLPNIAKWPERIEEAGPIGEKPVIYRDSFPRITDTDVEIGHNDVLVLTAHLLQMPKFRRILADRFPYVFVDEYQDSDRNLIDTIKEHVLNPGEGPLFGFFGDAWQKIYPGVCGEIQHKGLERVPAQSNFRSAPCIVNALNRLRPELPQVPSRTDAVGEIVVYHTNDWPGARRLENHWKGDLESNTAQTALYIAINELTVKGWDFSPEMSRRLLLTHTLLGREQGYPTITSELSRDDFEDLKDPILSYLHESFETARRMFLDQTYGEMFKALGRRVCHPTSPADKLAWVQEMQEIANLCETGTIGVVLDRIKSGKRIPLSQDVERRMTAFAAWDSDAEAEDEKLSRRMTKYKKTIAIPYTEVIALSDYHRLKTGFKTQHGVKGDEFPTVLVALGGGWNHYNTNQFLEWFPDQFPKNKQESYERMRNLFYVACSRAQGRLALLITQNLSDAAIENLRQIFGADTVQPLPYRDTPQ